MLAWKQLVTTHASLQDSAHSRFTSTAHCLFVSFENQKPLSLVLLLPHSAQRIRPSASQQTHLPCKSLASRRWGRVMHGLVQTVLLQGSQLNTQTDLGRPTHTTPQLITDKLKSDTSPVVQSTTERNATALSFSQSNPLMRWPLTCTQSAARLMHIKLKDVAGDCHTLHMCSLQKTEVPVACFHSLWMTNLERKQDMKITKHAAPCF